MKNKQLDESKKLKFTGERLIPNTLGLKFLYQEHITRYIFASTFVKDTIVLDAACGTGYGSSFLVENGASKVTGIDNSHEAIQYCNNNYSHSKLDFKNADCTQLPFKDSTFDIVVSFETIEHLENTDKFLVETKRVLKNNGIFIVSTPNIESYDEENPFHEHEFSLKEFESTLNNNFKNVSIFYQFYPSSIMIGNYNKINSFKTTIVDNEIDDETEPLYFIAICSDHPLPLIMNNNFIFKNSNLISGKKSHLKELRDQNTANENHLESHKDEIGKVRKEYEDKIGKVRKEYEDEIGKIRNSLTWKVLRTIDKFIGKNHKKT
jgi:O-antigen biosynthesis protein